MLKVCSHATVALTLIMSVTAFARPELVPIGDRRISINCDGSRGASATVVLMAGGNRTAQDWSKVQLQVTGFARVCSYDRAGLGESERTPEPQSVDEITGDLHAALQATHEPSPYILVAHSIAGMYARAFTTRFPAETVGLVLVDSSHEEQAMRQQEVFNATKAPPARMVELQGFFSKPGQRLEWRTKMPLIVVAHGKSIAQPGESAAELESWERAWRELQQDLAMRSPHGELRIAAESGHFIQLDQPEVVIEAIRDVIHTR